MEDSKTQRLELPGFGMSLTQLPISNWGYFMHALSNRFASAGLKLREARMMDLMSQITDKPEWNRKVFDEGIVNAWREEAMSLTREMDFDGDVYMSERMFDYVSDLGKTTSLLSLYHEAESGI